MSSAQISAGDLAGAIPLFRSLDPATVIGLYAITGMQRMFTSRQLILILEKYGVGDPSRSALPDLCVERWAVPIPSSKMTEALVAALDIVDADIDLVDFSRQPLPPGRLEFRRENLMRPPVPNASVIWRGRLLYDDRRSAAIWAKPANFRRTAMCCCGGEHSRWRGHSRRPGPGHYGAVSSPIWGTTLSSRE